MLCGTLQCNLSVLAALTCSTMEDTSIQQNTAHVFTQGMTVTKDAAQNVETCNFCCCSYTLGENVTHHKPTAT
jgi:hypothetical protein